MGIWGRTQILRSLLPALLLGLIACTDDTGVLDKVECLEMKVGPSCFTWARKLEKIDLEQAKTIHEKSCRMDHTEACVRLGDLHLEKSPETAHRWYKEACSAGNPRGCVKQAEVLLKMHGK